jgi:DNA-binding MarR family transcriptional regulator
MLNYLSRQAASCQALNHLGYADAMTPARASGDPRATAGPADLGPAGTHWLSTAEQRAWRTFLTACQVLFGAIDAQLQHEAGIPHGYYEILVRLSEAPGRALRMSQLAEASTSSKSRLSHAVARLEERGWIERAGCPEDGRGQVARLTDQGFGALAAAAPGHVAQVRRSLLDRLSAQQVEQLREISAAIAADDGPRASRSTPASTLSSASSPTTTT